MDHQQSKVYGAEKSVRRTMDLVASSPKRSITLHNSTLHLPAELRFGTLDAVQAYVRHVEAQEWYRCLPSSARPITVRRRKGNKAAHYEFNTIAINDTEYASRQWAMREIVVLHEVAHHVTDHGEDHGPEFVGAFLYLVRNAMGWEVEFLLADAMRSHGVDIAPVRV